MKWEFGKMGFGKVGFGVVHGREWSQHLNMPISNLNDFLGSEKSSRKISNLIISLIELPKKLTTFGFITITRFRLTSLYAIR